MENTKIQEILYKNPEGFGMVEAFYDRVIADMAI